VKVQPLIEVVSQLTSLPDELFICARRPWAHRSETVLVPFPEDLQVPAAVTEAGFEYYLEVSTAREVLEGFLERYPSLEQVADFLTFYAENDAFPEWAYEI
jgi:hypothetical protein